MVEDKRIFQIFIGIVACFLFSFSVCNAENFDSYDNGDKVNIIDDFASSSDFILISNATSSSPNNSVKVDAGGNSMVWNGGKNIDRFSFFYNLSDTENDLNCLDVYIFNLQECTGNISINLCNGPSKDDISITASSTYSVKVNNTMDNGWHSLDIFFFRDSKDFYLFIDDILDGTTYQMQASKSSDIDYIMLQGLNIYPAYVDDFNVINDNDLAENDYLAFITPLNWQDPVLKPTYNKNDFQWRLIYQIKNDTLSNYLDYNLSIQIDYKNASSATSTMLVLPTWQTLNSGNFTGLASDYYYLNEDNPLEIPKMLGDYTATATLRAYKYLVSPAGGYILATATSTWRMGTGTTDISTAWCNDLCWDLDLSEFSFFATTSIHFWNDITCGIRYAGCWLLEPHNFSKNYFSTGYENIKKTFPFNAFFSLTEQTKDALSYATSTNDTIGIPFIRNTGTTTEYYILPVLSSTSVSNLIGEENEQLYRNSVSWLLWIIVAVGIIIQIFTI
jgi:hypothetical protein